MSRRSALVGPAAALAVTLLAGCASSSTESTPAPGQPRPQARTRPHHGIAPDSVQDTPAPANRPAAPAGARDLLIITVDTLRADAIDTPAMLALAARGRHFRQATTPLPRTTPALASLLSGQTPAHHGSLDVGQPVVRTPGLVAAFRDAGWHTIGLSGTPVAGPEQGLDAGFEHFEVWRDPRAHDLAAAAIDRLDHRPGQRDPSADDRPVLLWVHFTDPHFPYLPADGPDAPRCRKLGELARDRKLSRSWIFGDFDGRASAARADCQLLYDAEVAAVDAAIPSLWQALDDPWVVLSSDHGENMGEEGLFYEHGPSLHDAALRIPLVIAGPGITAGVDDRPATLKDLAPTLLTLAGLAPLPDADGADLFGPLRPDAVAAVSGSVLQERLHTYLRSGRATGRNCVNLRPWSLCTDGLFDHLADPEQSHNVAAEHPDIVARLSAVARRWPAEQARERAVRSPMWKLRTRPTADGEQIQLYRLPDEQLAVDDNAVRARLAALLPAPLTPGPAADREHGGGGRDAGGAAGAATDEAAGRDRKGAASPSTDEALRALGYVE